MITTPVKQWRRQKGVAELIGKTGVIMQWTIIRTPAKLFVKEAPYPVVIVEMETLPAGRQVKKRMIGQLVDWEAKDLQKNQKVIAVLRRLQTEDKEGIIAYTIKFKAV